MISSARQCGSHKRAEVCRVYCGMCMDLQLIDRAILPANLFLPNFDTPESVEQFEDWC